MTKIRSVEDFISLSKDKHVDKYDYSKVTLEDIKNRKVNIICPIHGEFKQIIYNHCIKGRGCYSCGLNKLSEIGKIVSNGNSFKDKFPELCKEWSIKNKKTPEDYNSGSNSKVWRLCIKCNHEWKISIAKWSIGRNCPACAGKIVTDKNRLSIKFPDLIKEWNSKNLLKPENFSYSSHTRTWWICNHCKFEWETQICARTISESGCPKCKRSHGEKAVENYLINNNIKYQSQFRIKECKNKRTLPFDFAILDENNNLLGLIEYNGSQHYDIKFSEEQFKQTQITDKIKRNYCLENKINFLIIPYTEYNNIDKLIKNFYDNIRI